MPVAPHFDWTINLGQIVTWAGLIASFAYAMGRISSVVSRQGDDIKELKAAMEKLGNVLEKSANENSARFEAMTQQAQRLLEMLVQRRQR